VHASRVVARAGCLEAARVTRCGPVVDAPRPHSRVPGAELPLRRRADRLRGSALCSRNRPEASEEGRDTCLLARALLWPRTVRWLTRRSGLVPLPSPNGSGPSKDRAPQGRASGRSRVSV